MARTGRPRGFDREAALNSVMHLFWRHGYEGTSLDGLRRVMGGISSASFYAAFRSKEVLFREVLQRYRETHGTVVDPLRDISLPPRERIERTLRASARMQADASHPPGCLVTLSATVLSEDGRLLRALTANDRKSNRLAIRQCVEDAIRQGELRPETSVDGLAAMIDGQLLGLSLQTIDGTPEVVLEAAIDNLLLAWDAQRLTPPPSRKS